MIRAAQSCTGRSTTCRRPLLGCSNLGPPNISRHRTRSWVCHSLSRGSLRQHSGAHAQPAFLGDARAAIPLSRVASSARCAASRPPSSRKRQSPTLCGLIGDVPVIVAGRAVDELADDVGMPRVPSDFCRDMHHDLLQGDLPSLRGPPRNSARRVERERLDWWRLHGLAR